MTSCSTQTIVTRSHPHHHHPHRLHLPLHHSYTATAPLTFMGSGTGSHSGSGSSSGSNSPPPAPVKTEPKEDSDDAPGDDYDEGVVGDFPRRKHSRSHRHHQRHQRSSTEVLTVTAATKVAETGAGTPPSRHCSPPVGLLNNRNLVQDEKLVVATLASLESGDPSNIIKQDLRLIIQSRRKAEGKGELLVDFKTPPKDELTEEEWERARKRRDQNRLAAQRFRQKQRKISSSLSDTVRHLESANKRLMAELRRLESEKLSLVTLVRQHSCDCKEFDVKLKKALDGKTFSQQLTSEELEKRARRRELNRLAAKRSREKGQRRKDTLIQEIQGLQSRNGALEGAMGTLVEERDSLVRTLKSHLTRCKDSMAMSRSAQLLAFSHRLAQLLDWALPASASSASAGVADPAPDPPPLGSPGLEHAVGVELGTPTPAHPPPLPSQHPLHSPVSSLAPPGVQDSTYSSPPSPPAPVSHGPSVPSDLYTGPVPSRHPRGSGDLLPGAAPSPYPAVGVWGQESTYPSGVRSQVKSETASMSTLSESHSASSRELEIDASAAAALREEIERRQHRRQVKVATPTGASPTRPFDLPGVPRPYSGAAPLPSSFSPLSSPVQPPAPLLHSPSYPFAPSSHLSSPSPQSLPPSHLSSPSRSLPPHLPSPSHSFPPPHLPSPSSHSLPPHLPSPSHPFPPPHLPSPSSHSLPPHLSSPSHPFVPPLPSPSSSLPPPRPSGMNASQDSGGGDSGFGSTGFPGPAPEMMPYRAPMSSPAAPAPGLLAPREENRDVVIKRPQSLDLRGAGIIPKKDPALRSPVIPKKDPALRSPGTTPKKDPALRSPLIPKKDPALRSPVIMERSLPSSPSSIPVSSSSASSFSASANPFFPASSMPSSVIRSSGVFKRGPVQRVASFHGVSASASSTSSSDEQVAPLNLSKRRKSEDFGCGGFGSPSAEPQGRLSGLHTWPPPASAGLSWVKQEEEEAQQHLPLNLICRGRSPPPPNLASPGFSGPPTAAVVQGHWQLERGHRQGQGHPGGVIKGELPYGTAPSVSGSRRADAASPFSSAGLRGLRRFNSYDGAS